MAAEHKFPKITAALVSLLEKTEPLGSLIDNLAVINQRMSKIKAIPTIQDLSEYVPIDLSEGIPASSEPADQDSEDVPLDKDEIKVSLILDLKGTPAKPPVDWMRISEHSISDKSQHINMFAVQAKKTKTSEIFETVRLTEGTYYEVLDRWLSERDYELFWKPTLEEWKIFTRNFMVYANITHGAPSAIFAVILRPVSSGSSEVSTHICYSICPNHKSNIKHVYLAAQKLAKNLNSQYLSWYSVGSSISKDLITHVNKEFSVTKKTRYITFSKTVAKHIKSLHFNMILL